MEHDTHSIIPPAGPAALVHLENEDHRCLQLQRKSADYQTTHDVSQIPQTSKTTSQHHKETQHDVTPQGTCTYHMRKVKNRNTSKHKYAGILNITETKNKQYINSYHISIK